MDLEEFFRNKLAEARKNKDIKLYKKIEALIKISENIFIENNVIDEVIIIPNLNYGYSDILLVADCESDNPRDWKKLELANRQVNVNSGDIIKFR